MNRLQMLERRKANCHRRKALVSIKLKEHATSWDSPTYNVWVHLHQLYGKAALNTSIKIDSEHLHHI